MHEKFLDKECQYSQGEERTKDHLNWSINKDFQLNSLPSITFEILLFLSNCFSTWCSNLERQSKKSDLRHKKSF